MNRARTARERARAELTQEIIDIARRQLADVGASGLSLRAVSRELGMVSSALHRYFPTRDDLLTSLIAQGYAALGDAVEGADAAAPRDDHWARWEAATAAIRSWALAHPHEYALIYGSPVPGYEAPRETVTDALRAATVLVGILGDAYAVGRLDTTDEDVVDDPDPQGLAEDAARVRNAVTVDLPDRSAARAVTAWTAVFGHVSFELFGQFDNAIVLRDAMFTRNMHLIARMVGLRPL